jgi:hypothetical protein
MEAIFDGPVISDGIGKIFSIIFDASHIIADFVFGFIIKSPLL